MKALELQPKAREDKKKAPAVEVVSALQLTCDSGNGIFSLGLHFLSV